MGTEHILLSREGYLNRENYKGELYKLRDIYWNSKYI